MREVKKLEPYRILADALAHLHDQAPTRPWRLAVVGDGPARPAVAGAFAGLPPGRVAFLGSLDPEVLPTAYLGADVFAFPGRFHVVYLQAAAAGLPVVACAGPEPDPMVAPGGALLTAATPDAFAAGIARLLDDPALRQTMGAAARRFITADRTLETFQHRLAAGLSLLGLSCARSTSR
jgi:glycosyltransferase involved in cell wall biosynthesis